MARLTKGALVSWTTAMAACLSVCGVATAAPAQSAVGDLSSGPSNIRFDAHRSANAPAAAATGQFVAHAAVGPLSLFTLRGPITCLDVRGNRAGLFYPITSSTPPLFSMLNGGVFIYIQLNKAGKAKSIGFLPVPFSHVSSCTPGPALLPVTAGTAALTS